MQLFVDEVLTFQKKAAVELEEDATQWPRQVLTELFRVMPEISEYTPDVKFMKVNEEQGYALGTVVVTNSTNSALTTAGQSQGPAAPKALIPLVIKNGKLCPLDTVMSASGRMFPLTVERLREVLYRPESFELLGEDWGDNSIAGLFAVPGRGDFGTGQTGGSGGIQYLQGPGMKQASLLDSIAGTVLGADLDKVAAALEDEALRDALLSNLATREAVCKLATMEPVTEKQAAAYESAIENMHPPQVIHMTFDEEAGCYALKTANRDYGVTRSFHLDRGDFLRFVGEKLAAEVDRQGTTVAAESGKARVVFGTNGEALKKIEHPGHYDVYNAQTGQRYHGMAIPELVDAEGNRQPLVLFVCEQGASVQGELAGTTNWNDSYDLPKDAPKGQGCFYHGRVGGPGGGARATVPVKVQGSQSGNGSIRYSCVDLTGEELTVVLQRGIESIVTFPKQKEILLPWNAGFISLSPELPELVDSGEAVEKTASLALEGRLTVTATPGEIDTYHIKAHNVPKLASLVQGRGFSYDAALFNLCVAGLGPDDAFGALDKVATAGRCEVLCEDIGALPEVDGTKIAAGIQEIRALRPGLLKEAAAIPDSMTVDAVLSLDFINSENVRTFISMIPQLEKALNKTCELVFASRLGLTEIPETAAARAARGLNDAVRGLKALALRQIEELP